jgi:hypothetical protein
MESNAEWTSDLVAYLDGELDEAAKRNVESLLASNPDARAELTRLERSWDLLDSLPAASVGEEFARSTLEMAALSAEQDAQASQVWRRIRRQRTWLLGLASLAIAATAGYAGVERYLPDRNARLMQDLPLLWHLDAYIYAGNLEFVRQLAEPRLFGGEFATVGPPATAAPNDEPAEAVGPPDEPAELDDEQKRELLRRFERFEAMDDVSRDRMRQLHVALEAEAEADRDAAYRALYLYRDWLLSLTLARRTALLDLEPSERAAPIAKALELRAWAEGPLLAPADRVALVAWIQQRFDDAVADLPAPARERIARQPAEQRREAALQLAGRLPVQRPGQFRPDAIQALVSRLSPELQTAWEKAASQTVDDKSRVGKKMQSPDQPRFAPTQRDLFLRWVRAAASQELAELKLPPWRMGGAGARIWNPGGNSGGARGGASAGKSQPVPPRGSAC